MWCGISKRRIIDPYFFSETTVSGETYRNMLSTYPIPRIRALQGRPIFMQDGAPPHIYGPMQQILDKIFGKNWIAKNRPLAWPTHSPELNPCDFYLWKPIECNVYQVPITSIEYLKNRIREAIQSINENTLMRVWYKMKNRLDLLMYENGGHIEHML